MNTSALKSFAPAVRRQLMEAVTRKLDYVLTADTADLRAAATEVKSLRQEAERDRKGLVERVAYTWFNRLAALRFLDARGWHPFKARVLTAGTPAETQPELLKLLRSGSLPAELLPHTDLNRLNDLLDGRLPTAIAGADPQGEAYRDLILAVCRFYHVLMPNLFEKLNDETELLLPDDLLTATSVAEGFRTEISDDDCSDVEILGWLYQFYISERKDQVMARKSAVPTEDIPAVTQLFTPHWIVRYLVENSLGRLWLLNRPGSRLREHMPYYIEGEPETDFLKITKPEEIRLLDPAVGSGHMLTYAFDLLTLIYEEEGYAPTEIPVLILRHNLHGLEICPRAAQLAELALVFKAREKSRRFFQPEHIVRPAIIELREVRFAENELRDYIRALGLGDLFQQPLLKLLHQFEEAKNFGSLIQPCLDERTIAEVRRAIEGKDHGGQLFLRETHLKVLRVLAQAEALTQRYHVVVANPPYLGGSQMNARLKAFAETTYPKSKSDLFAMFVERAFGFAVRRGFTGMITMQSWMFLSSFETFRADLLTKRTLHNMAHLGSRAFDSIGGEVVQATAFIYENYSSPDHPAIYLKLTAGRTEADKELACRVAIADSSCLWRFRATGNDLTALPGTPIAYWLTGNQLRAFAEGQPLSKFGKATLGMNSTNNSKFVRLWSEVEFSNIEFNALSEPESGNSACRWFPYNKGGTFRKWYGNREHIINWHKNGKDIHEYNNLPISHRGAPVRSKQYQFKEAITWSFISSASFGVRYAPTGSMFDVAGSSYFPQTEDTFSICGFLCSCVAATFLKGLNPTLNVQTGNVGSLPYLPKQIHKLGAPAATARACIEAARADWDNFETSWDFRDQPLLRPGLKGATLEASWRNWEAQSTAAIRRMQELETENNRLFIAAYGLDGELQPEVPEEQITLARADARRDMAAFLSYAVGCMMGRYSLDHPGLILADAGASLPDVLAKVGRPLEALTFAPDEDGIIPVLDGEWFEDDIVARTRDFLRATFGAAHLDANVAWLEKALDKDLRKYFVRDFYKDHISNERAYGYKKRPIYWLVSSPGGSFQALLYLHRYTKDTINTVLNSYLREFIHKLDARLKHLGQVEASSTNAREKIAARKEADKLRKSLKECQEWEREVVLPLAQQRIELDLDDGVKVNYQKFTDFLAMIPGLEKKEEG